MKIALIVSGLVFLLLGCTSTVWVEEKVTKDGVESVSDVGGIPFYTKKEIYKQVTSYSRSWLVATLSVEKFLVTEKDGKFETFPLDKQGIEKHISKSQLSELNGVREAILQPGLADDARVEALLKAFSRIDGLTDFSSVAPVQIENKITSSWVVDESSKYFLNAPLPWFGSGDLTQELNSDGTLSKVISSPDTKLSEGISSLIPIKEYLTGKFVDPLEDDTDAKAAEKLTGEGEALLAPMLNSVDMPELRRASELVYKATLSISESGYIYSFENVHENFPSTIAPIPFDTSSQIYTRNVIGEKPGATEKKDEDKSVGVSGTISFPKGWGK
ncbi:hypothetical protein [Marinobacter maritimus]|uniref:hypothetical protein n=1 Tax=Marinobacter maritimus TaxID=277961 RepID=UPI00119DB7A8|nr:hypothetical protein [Marinobacter maritimus]